VNTSELEAWGVDPGYWDVAGNWKEIPEATARAVLEVMCAGTREPGGPAPLVTIDQSTADQVTGGQVTGGQEGGGGRTWPHWLPAGTLVLEEGGTVRVWPGAPQPAEVPAGYHRLEPEAGGAPLTVAVCPPRCPSPPDGRSWGWSSQVYATRSLTSWGIGDFADLRRLVSWAGQQGAGFVLLNPLHAPAAGPVPEPSPYFPSSRCFLNPLYIRIEEVPGAADLADVAVLAEQARALNEQRLIDRSRVWALKSQALETLFARSEEAGADERFETYVNRRGRVLDGYTSFCVLGERYGLPWQDWPEEYRHPSRPEVGELANGAGRARKRYHAWLQWLCEVQLAGATQANGAGLICDLAVGVDGGGADAWLWQDTFALGMRVGAPPDEFNTRGQDWALPPWDPWKLRAAAYEPYIEMLRAVLRPAQGLRVDHVMGLFRLFWVPLGSEPWQGAYVRYVWQDMVGLLRLEASRAGTYVVGEDLGTVEDHVRHVLAQSGVLSYKLLWFEPQRPDQWPGQALAAVTTHDLPTVAGVWTGADAEAQRRSGIPLNEQGAASLRRRLAEWTGSDDGRPVPEVIEATYAALAEAPCALRAAALDDALAVEERPNMPGTIDQWPNWCLALPASLEQIEQSALAAAIAARLGGR
jgi:4-alpha-glucanotransferase